MSDPTPDPHYGEESEDQEPTYGEETPPDATDEATGERAEQE